MRLCNGDRDYTLLYLFIIKAIGYHNSGTGSSEGIKTSAIEAYNICSGTNLD